MKTTITKSTELAVGDFLSYDEYDIHRVLGVLGEGELALIFISQSVSFDEPFKQSAEELKRAPSSENSHLYTIWELAEDSNWAIFRRANNANRTASDVLADLPDEDKAILEKEMKKS